MNKRFTWCAALAATVAVVVMATPHEVRRAGKITPPLTQHAPYLPAAATTTAIDDASGFNAPMAEAAASTDVVFTLHPTEEEFNSCKKVNANNDEYEIRYYVVTGLNGKLYDWPIYYTNNNLCKLDADEWFFTPAFTLGDIENLYEISVDVIGGAKFRTPESFQICLGKEDTPEAMTQVILDEPSIFHDEFKKVSSTFGIREAGTYYVGIHITSPSNAFRIAMRDITISHSAESAGAPLGVSELKATPDPTGANNATVEFIMPEYTLNGKPMANSTQLEATLVSSEETVTVNGLPGQKVSKVIATGKGDNVITVTVKSSEGVSPEAKVTVRTSIDMPSDPVVATSISEDNMSMTITWLPVTTGANNGVVIPEDIKYNVYQYVENETENGSMSGWMPVAKNLTECRYDFSCEDEIQTLYEFFVTAVNEGGETDGSVQCLSRAQLGKLIQLPMAEDFSSMVIEYGGYMVDSPYDSDLSYEASWGFVTSDKIVPESGTVGCLSAISQRAYATNGRFNFPKFDAKGKSHMVADFSVWIDEFIAPTVVSVLSSNGKRMKIGEFSSSSGNGWCNFQFTVPADMDNADWAQIQLETSLPTYQHALLISKYELRELDKNDLAVESITVGKAVINEPVDVSVVIRNRGSENATVGKLTSAVYRRYFKVADLELDGKNQTLAGNESITLTGKFTVVHSDFADTRLTARVRIPGEDDNKDNNFAELEFRLYGSGDPVVSDLTGSANSAGDGIALSWTHPDDLPPIESFESCDHGDFSGTIAQWNNVDFDGKATWTVEGTYFPNGVEPKAFQAIDCSQIDNENFVAHTGNYALFVWSAQEAQSDDWLISPEIDPSEGFSFWSQIIDGSFTEVIEVMASSTDREIDSFELVQTITQNTYGWKFNSVALPANTKYVALHYCSNDQFGMVIDDIFVKTASKLYDVKGFNLYRNGEKVTRLTTTSFEDIHADYSKNIYHVSVLASKNGEPEKEYARSNEFTLGESAIDGPAADSNITVTAGYGVLTVTGAQSATVVKVYAADGKLVASETAKATVNISLPAGVYMITVGERVFKAAVR